MSVRDERERRGIMLNTIRQILIGAEEINEKLKYQAIAFMIGTVHVIFMVTFFLNHFTVLAYYNVAIVLFYILMIFLIAKINRFSGVFLAVFIEILMHSAIATAYFGWSCGFMGYTIALIPMGFYITYTIKYLRSKLYIPIIVSLVVFATYFAVYIAMVSTDSMYKQSINEFFAHNIYLFNQVMMLLFLLTASVMFSIEIRYMQYHLEAENVSLSRMANFDALTKLMNRRSMNIQLKQVLDEMEIASQNQDAVSEEDNTFCLLMTDIDDFKKVNDTWGHPKGDEVLVEVARVLQSNVREADKVCRWGGEEMLVLVRSNMEVAKSVAQRICMDMAGTQIEVGDSSSDDNTTSQTISVTLTIGVSEYHPGDSIRSMIETADQRMYKGKRSGKNCVVAS